jgi:DNA-binding transcriptional LysR family regulator
LGVSLLARTTRSVSPTDAGERLIQTIAARLQEIESEIAAVSELGDKAAGVVRITALDYVIDTVLWPRLAKQLERYPDVHVELCDDYRLVELTASR